MSGLFRKQAVTAQQQKLHGEISLAQPLSLYITSFVIFIVVVISGLFLSFSYYARKETVQGYLVPDKGVIKMYANTSGNLAELHVKEGDKVVPGMPLATIIIRRSLISGTELSESILNELTQQLVFLNNENKQNQALSLKDTARLNISLTDIRASMNVNDELQSLLAEKLALQFKQQAQHKKLHLDGFLSTLEYQAQEEKLILIKQELADLRSSQIRLNSELNTNLAELSALPHHYELKQAETQRRQSDLKRQLDETENNYRYVIRASEAGTIAAIQLVEGEFIGSNRPVMSLIPKGAVLVAELLLPTRSAGFVQVGDEARLRFDAFPYQRFGSLNSQVSRIDKVLLLDGEADVPVSLSEPVYRIRTVLSSQSVSAYGDDFTLKSGMLLEADIVLDRRSLLDWLLDPIYSLRGRVG
ncbi:HlyD family efflux transporter periplasmic adaptor subunit [Shewanella surugensis]|uniref:HlyD family efflux transporter periplasmic adaptor subunit n=1 Tax=Shewanella surugensis TaxID=212020 RepID=A0ABT0LFM6_9GAMM|nr:HlyD family efflux transporter periplasmic adaptor subunit [Shewanella surugensis]MCL1125961.1 HlyD family efflux transporter periplasmic adaptor subunit [Shewanella surugensis]